MIVTVFGFKLGRKNWILLGNVVEIVGTVISASSYSYGQLSKCRPHGSSFGTLLTMTSSCWQSAYRMSALDIMCCE